eukprot:Transcript_13552.p1 GENE.Transcript_13552~~Transcript_13552.p1  ORF type:complete len:354 (-),score=135.97 Transcript_13552:172-1233(-)
MPEKPPPIPPESLVPLGTRPSPAWPDARVPHAPSGTTWRVDLVDSLDYALYEPPKLLFVRCPMHGLRGDRLGTTLAFPDLPAECTVWALKAMVDERLLLRPEQVVRLFTWGRELEDDSKLVADYFVADRARLEMRLGMRRPDPDRELNRVRITNSLLQTRQFPVEPTTTVLDLKQKIEESCHKYAHEWVSEDGLHVTRCEGCTWLIVGTVKRDDKADLGGVKIGDEFVSDRHVEALDRKKGVLVVRRVKSGRVVKVAEANAAILDLPPDKQRLNFQGRNLTKDDLTLWELGVRQDDQIELEFLSPVQPEKLKILRAPAPEKGAKKGRSAGGKGGKAAGGKKKGGSGSPKRQRP